MRVFKPGWRITAFVAFFLPSLIMLGFWQLDRGAQKRDLQIAYIEKITQLPAPATQENLNIPFQRVRIEGKFTQEVFLLDNQIYAGKVGYWIIQAFEDNRGVKLLTNRGFIPAAPAREKLPEIVTPSVKVSLVGIVWPSMGLIPLLDEDVLALGWPKRIQRLDLEKMAGLTAALAIEIRLDGGQTWVTQPAPDARLLTDAKHRGYAVTWFGLAIALSVLYLMVGFRREN